jgi:tRNA(Ile)-lysidine synthase
MDHQGPIAGKSPATHLPRADYSLLRAVSEGLSKAGFPQNAPLILAVSGGADSVAMLSAVAQLARVGLPGPSLIVAVSVNHGLRESAADDVSWVEGLCRRLNVDFEGVSLGPCAKDEQSLRTARYRALLEVADRREIEQIATGHTADDQVETILLRLVRGAGRLGLSGIPARNGRYVRPLLALRRCELEAYLQRQGHGWLEDPSNKSMDYARNRVRHMIVPAFEEAFGKGALEHLPEAADRWRIEEVFLRREAERSLDACLEPDPAVLNLGAFASVPEELAAGVLRAWYRRLGGRPELGMRGLRDLEALVANHRGGARITLGNCCFSREGQALRCALLNSKGCEASSPPDEPSDDRS